MIVIWHFGLSSWFSAEQFTSQNCVGGVHKGFGFSFQIFEDFAVDLDLMHFHKVLPAGAS
ncbi:hypothetical protein BTJ49_04380 [Oleiagrimonas sp. MCCC 1A03011]|nr:hypothetical protein BTJ49_04380 [Oleiagrimonas sp. MCCC 1A03011]